MVLVEPARAIWAGGIPQASFAIFKAWMNASRVGRAMSHPFCGWSVEAMSEESMSRGGYPLTIH